jgi:hypothetical protein
MIILSQVMTNNNNKFIAISKHLCFVKREHKGLDQSSHFDNINRIITSTMITISVTHLQA